MVLLLVTTGGVAHALSCSGAQQVTIATRLERPLQPRASILVYVDSGHAPTFQLGRKGQRAVQMPAKRLAPGLYRYQVDAPLKAGTYQLTTRSKAQIRTMDGTLVVAKGRGVAVRIASVVQEDEPVPALTTITFEKKAGGMWSPKFVYNLALEFERALPRRFVAVIGAWQGKKPSVLRKPNSGRLIVANSAKVIAFATPIRCGRLPARAVAPKNNAMAALALVDEFGELHAVDGIQTLRLASGK